ncbi:gas vesicle protein K [Saccharopolyspora sp. NPDC049426]|uniref:gas vesicle protein K n=1 Tax=Saccharopolyspora sp. NPDC049426 TaxID=3155652 RepID=UPI00342FB0E9
MTEPNDDTHVPSRRLQNRVEADSESIKRDLVRLVLTIVELVRQLMERQALRRVDEGDLSEEQVEEIGLALMQLAEAVSELQDHFDLTPEDLNLDLGPLGSLLPDDRKQT